MTFQHANADQHNIDAVSTLLNGTSFEIRSDKFCRHELLEMTNTIRNWSVMFRGYQEEGQLDIAEFFVDHMRHLFSRFLTQNGGRFTREPRESPIYRAPPRYSALHACRRQMEGSPCMI